MSTVQFSVLTWHKLRSHRGLCGRPGWCTRWSRCGSSSGSPCTLCELLWDSTCRTSRSLPGRPAAHSRTNTITQLSLLEVQSTLNTRTHHFNYRQNTNRNTLFFLLNKGFHFSTSVQKPRCLKMTAIQIQLSFANSSVKAKDISRITKLKECVWNSLSCET